jgi:hypothetical protein
MGQLGIEGEQQLLFTGARSAMASHSIQVPQKFVHLYLAELSYRFNHRDQDLFPLLHKALRHTDNEEIKRLLVRSA